MIRSAVPSVASARVARKLAVPTEMRSRAPGRPRFQRLDRGQPARARLHAIRRGPTRPRQRARFDEHPFLPTHLCLSVHTRYGPGVIPSLADAWVRRVEGDTKPQHGASKRRAKRAPAPRGAGPIDRDRRFWGLIAPTPLSTLGAADRLQQRFHVTRSARRRSRVSDSVIERQLRERPSVMGIALTAGGCRMHGGSNRANAFS
jgi:hypothetical protein